MKDKILVVGGYGSVGRIIAATVGEKFPGQVTVAGRNYHKAEELAAALDHKVLPLALDVTAAHEEPDFLDGVSLVIMCLDQEDTQFVELCLQRGINYIDVTASYDFLAQVETLDAIAKSHDSSAVLSVGLAPGLTNLLASHARSQFDETQQLDIHIMLGLGEVHGEAAVRWTVENINAEFTVLEDGHLKKVRSFEDSKQTLFPEGLGNRATYRFNFSDQHVLPKTLGVDSVSTRLSLDSALTTSLLALLKKSRAFAFLRYQAAQDALVKLLNTFRFGSAQFVLKVDALGLVNGQKCAFTSALTGNSEGQATGFVTARVAELLYTSSFPSGVFHIDQLFEPIKFIGSLSDHGLNFSHSNLAAVNGRSPVIFKTLALFEQQV